jgi:hypothetical protein
MKLRKIPNPGVALMFGRLIPELVRCGKPTCRCAAGERHGPYWYLRWRDRGRQRRAYIPAAKLERMRYYLALWRAVNGPTQAAMRREQALYRRLGLPRW